jgi:hypothetical protein
MSIAVPPYDTKPFVEIVSALFNGDGGLVDLRAMRGDRCTLELYAADDHRGIANFLELFDDHNLFFGVASRRALGAGGGADNLQSLGALFVDIDFKTSDEAEARARLAAFPLAPTLQIASGGGLHVYWATRESFTFPADADAAGAWLRRLAATLGGDPSATDITRVLRVAGSANLRYSPRRPVVVEAADFSRRYNVEADFDELLVADPDPTTASRSEPFQLPLGAQGAGRRHKTMFAFGRSLKAKGGTVEMVRAALTAYNQEACQPPKSPAEVEEEVQKVFKARDRKTFALPVVEADPEPAPAAADEPPASETDPDAPPATLATLLDDVARGLARYIVMTPAQADAVALWTSFTYVVDAFDIAPYLHVTAGTKKAGKSRLMELLRMVVKNGWYTCATTRAALVRKLHADKSTLLHDEIDTALGDGKSENATALIGILNAGYSRFLTATICVGEGANITTKEFTVYSPKALAGIGALPSTIADRSIEIRLRAKRKVDQVTRARDRDARAALAPLQRRLEAWGAGATSVLDGARPDLPDDLDDRAQDIWEPLLAIAALAGEAWPERAWQAAIALSAARLAELDAAAQLLSDLRDVLPGLTVEHGIVQTTFLLGALQGLEHRPWATWSRGELMTPHALAGKLKAFDVVPVRADLRNTKREGKHLRGYAVADLTAAFERHLPPLPQTSGGNGGSGGAA